MRHVHSALYTRQDEGNARCTEDDRQDKGIILHEMMHTHLAQVQTGDETKGKKTKKDRRARIAHVQASKYQHDGTRENKYSHTIWTS